MYSFSHALGPQTDIDFFAFDSNAGSDYVVHGYPEKGAKQATEKSWYVIVFKP